MSAPRLPRRVVLPSRLEVRLEARDAPGAARDPVSGPRFAAALDVLQRGVVRVADAKGAAIDPRGLPLADFHVLRALLLRSGFLHEEEIDVACRNCDAPVRGLPCRGLEIAPYADGELDDPELDHTTPFGEPIPIAEIALGRARRATSMTLAPRTVGDAEPLFKAVSAPSLDLDASVVRALGIVALGAERDPARIAEALAHASDEAFADVADAWLSAHYAPRLGAVLVCRACGARNDVDAPWQRELEPGSPTRATGAGSSAFPSFDAFAERADALAARHLAAVRGDPVSLVVVDRPADVDDGGEPLLGSYLPASPGDAHTAPSPPTVTVYFRTFQAMWNEEGPYDWEAELDETLEHELLHHEYHLRGDDPMDEEEREEIRAEGLRVVGRRESQRRAVRGLGVDLGEFFRRTWPLWIVALAALLLGLLTSR